VYFARFFDFAHKALEDFARTQSLYREWFQNPEVVAPIKTVSADFKKPVRLNDELQIKIFLTQSSDHSLSFEYQFFNGHDLCAKLSSVHVFIDKKTLVKCPIPQSLLKSLEV
jgi:YbgC/YbaW family acyl-CoA thioester hydrolase